MIVKATSLAKRIDLRDACGHLVLKPSVDGEDILLAKLYLAISQGGTITVKLPKKRAQKFIYGESK